MIKIKLWLANVRIWIAPAIVAVQLFFVSLARAQTTPVVSPVTDQQDVATLLCNIISWMFWIIIVISVIMVMYAAYTYVTASDDTEKTAKGRRILTYAAVGIAVALIAAGFPSIVASIFPNNPGTTLTDTCTAF